MVKSISLAILMLFFLVATGYSAPFTEHGNGTVTDQYSELMWQQEDDNTIRNWQTSLDYCNSLALGGYTNWRLPNMKELESIVDYATHHPAINAIFIGTNSSMYWTSTSMSEIREEYRAWYVTFEYGYVDHFDKTYNYYARCVR